jgi:hypothetical protein
VDLNASPEKDPLLGVRKLAPTFAFFFEHLWSLMCSNDMKLAQKIEKDRKSNIQTVPVMVSESRPTTPDRPPIAPDPNYSGSSSNSQDEEPTKQLAGTFLSATMFFLEDDFCQIKFQTRTNVRLRRRYNLQYHLLIYRAKVTTKFTFEGETTKKDGNRNYGITAINDGGIVIHYVSRNRKKEIEWRPDSASARPVLGVEVNDMTLGDNTNTEAKRMHAKVRNSKELEDKFAAQIFCEMLGQTCYPDFYNRTKPEYQEVIR